MKSAKCPYTSSAQQPSESGLKRADVAGKITEPSVLTRKQMIIIRDRDLGKKKKMAKH